MKNYRFFLLLAVAMLSLQLLGCSSVQKTLSRGAEATKGTYKKFLNTDPCVDLDQDSGCSQDEVKIAQIFMPVDRELGRLVRTQYDRDTYPPDGWTDMLLEEFNWLNGVVVTDTQGDVLASRPSAAIKQPDLSSILDKELEWTRGSLRWFLQETDLGPEFVLVSPFFKDNAWQGLIVTHFDFRSLARLSPDPQAMMAFSPEAVVWSGSYSAMQQDVLSRDWDAMLDDDVMGRLELDGGTFLWLTRYIGEQPLIYAVKCLAGE